MQPAHARQNQSIASTGQDATSTSGLRTIALPVDDVSGAPASTPGLRGIVITPESAGESSPGEPSNSPSDLGKFQVEFAYDTQFFADLSRDLTRGGIVIATYRDLPVGTPVHLAFELPDGASVEVRGEVRWIREEGSTERRGLAIAFTQISNDALSAISEYCRVRPPLFLDIDG